MLFRHKYVQILLNLCVSREFIAASPQKGDELSGGGGKATEYNGCSETEAAVVERSFSHFKKQRYSVLFSSFEMHTSFSLYDCETCVSSSPVHSLEKKGI